MDEGTGKSAFAGISSYGHYWTNSPSVGETISDTEVSIGSGYSKGGYVGSAASSAKTTTTKRENGALIRCLKYGAEI